MLADFRGTRVLGRHPGDAIAPPPHAIIFSPRTLTKAETCRSGGESRPPRDASTPPEQAQQAMHDALSRCFNRVERLAVEPLKSKTR